MSDSKWKRVKYASDCSTCECCGEPFCDECGEHYADCECPGPDQDDEWDYNESHTFAIRKMDTLQETK